MIILIFYVACTVKDSNSRRRKKLQGSCCLKPGKFNLKVISILDETFRSHSQNRLMTGKIRGLKEIGSDGEDRNRVVFEAVQGINVETEVFC